MASDDNRVVVLRATECRRLLQQEALMEQVCDTLDQKKLDELMEESHEEITGRLVRVQKTVPAGTRTLHLIPGLPGSGKTTLAHRMLGEDQDLVRINRDDLRRMLLGARPWNAALEVMVRRCQETAVVAAVASGRDVVCDDTLLTELARWRLLGLAEDHGLRVVVHPECLRVPVETCIERDAARESPVGRDVILGMAPMVGFLWGDLL